MLKIDFLQLEYLVYFFTGDNTSYFKGTLLWKNFMVLMAAKDFIRLQIQIHIFPVRTFQKLNVDQFEGDLACLEENVQGSRWLAQQIGVQFQRHFFFNFESMAAGASLEFGRITNTASSLWLLSVKTPRCLWLFLKFCYFKQSAICRFIERGICTSLWYESFCAP